MRWRHDNARNEEEHTPVKFMYFAVITVTSEMWRSVICIAFNDAVRSSDYIAPKRMNDGEQLKVQWGMLERK